MGLFAYGNTNKCKMDINEDSYAVKKIGDYIILMVADGNGSKEGMINPGALAISIMNDYLVHIIKSKTSIKEIYNQMAAAMFTVSRCFLSVNAIDDKYNNIYASMTVAIIEEISLNMVFASIGNTEISLLRNGRVSRINKLFSEAYSLYNNNEITEEELYTHPKRAILTSALGIFDDAKIDIMMTQLAQEDILLFTTDGLYRCMTPQSIIRKLAENGEDIGKAVDKILENANEMDCPDNATMICCYIHDDNSASIDKTHVKSGYKEPDSMYSKAYNSVNDNGFYDPYNGL